ncbi:hypothetical protein DH2020_012267 [Rehmannia glutinosa]|uniref:TCP domain-containing protein n=1 Tax=Rehmannia glutinosa TaxID=99300 RepID=A0ABR0X092_REHGL
MIRREADFSTKQENSTSDYNKNISKTASSTNTATTSWSRLKDPRIVRVSRALGGKDRHSKVCTVRGLRDRRVRLSVPTAIQLYDLQDRLGLNQPSKVVDWLLNAAKHEIDELPPLQFPEGCFSQTYEPISSSQHSFTSSAKHDLENQGELNDFVARQNLFNSSPNTSSYNNSFVRWENSNQTLNHHYPSISLGLNNCDDLHNFMSLVQLPSSSSTMLSHNNIPSSNQVLVYQPYFPNSSTNNIIMEFDTKQQHNNFQTSSSSELPNSVRPFHFSMAAANLLPSRNNAENEQE